ncbi:MAG: acyltransferase, partial [Dietzia sp.]|nr:acyltransferase [Dietzia sp.]
MRALAVLAVFAAHLWGWPRGGFVGVDVFFVIAGFFVTDGLLRTAGETGTLSLPKFYWDRLRRIVPAAAVVLALTFAASIYVLPPSGAREIGVDALFSLAFLANWHFAAQGAYPATATDLVSPLLHYWPLSIEEQFYFVWPALIFVISLIAVRWAWSRARWLLVTGAVMGVVVAASLAFAVYATASSPAWAFLNTFTRVWELGVGALLATAT